MSTTIFLTGQQVYEAYQKLMRDEKYLSGVKRLPTEIRKWEHLSLQDRYLYDGLATYLNIKIAEQEAKP